MCNRGAPLKTSLLAQLQRFRDLGALYEAALTGGSAALPPLSSQYTDFSEGQRQWFQGEVLEKQLF